MNLLESLLGSGITYWGFLAVIFATAVYGFIKLLEPLKKGEFAKFGLLMVNFGLIIGTYWLLRPLKDSVFGAVVGVDYLQNAKWLSLLIIFPLVILYSRLVDLFPRQKLFYVLCGIYALLAALFAYLMMSPTYGLAAGDPSPTRLWGWAWYVFVESFGSLIVALFWAFATETTAPDSAARGFPLVAFGAQVGNILGPWFGGAVLARFAKFELSPEGALPIGAAEQSAGVHAGLVFFAAAMIVLIGALIWVFLRVVPADQLVGYQTKSHDEEHNEPGFFEGIKLLFSSPYLLSIFAVIIFYEIIITAFDVTFKVFAKAAYPASHDFSAFLFDYGTTVGIVSMLSILWGINKVQKLVGVGASLALLPLLVTGAVAMFYGYPKVTVLFWIMVFSKAINYALNQPTMKQLYIPTSKEAKYKSQAFIEMYGSRGSKALGAGVHFFRKPLVAAYGATAGLHAFVGLCSLFSLGLIAIWIPVALYLGRTYKKAIDENKIVV